MPPFTLLLLCAAVVCAQSPTPALLDAALRGDRDRIRALLASGADPAAADGSGTTPLMNAARAGDLPSVRLLIAAGARVRIWGPEGRAAWDLAPPLNAGVRDELARQRARELHELPAVLPSAGISLQAMLRMLAAPSLVNAGATARLRHSLVFLRGRWSNAGGHHAAKPSPIAADGFARSLGRDLYALDLALSTRNGRLLDTLAADLETKAADCAARPEGLGGDVKVTLKTISRTGEVRGWKLTYVERFLWDLRDKIPSFESQWHECSRLSAAVGEPIPAGNYAVVATSPEARPSQPKMIEVAATRPAVFEIVVP
jgi:hypothetical protein